MLLLLRTFSVLLTAKKNLGPRATQVYSEMNKPFYPVGTSQRYLFFHCTKQALSIFTNYLVTRPMT
jgi:hypothetical protein